MIEATTASVAASGTGSLVQHFTRQLRRASPAELTRTLDAAGLSSRPRVAVLQPQHGSRGGVGGARREQKPGAAQHLWDRSGICCHDGQARTPWPRRQAGRSLRNATDTTGTRRGGTTRTAPRRSRPRHARRGHRHRPHGPPRARRRGCRGHARSARDAMGGQLRLLSVVAAPRRPPRGRGARAGRPRAAARDRDPRAPRPVQPRMSPMAQAAPPAAGWQARRRRAGSRRP